MNDPADISEDLGATSGVHREAEIARREAGTYSGAEVDTEHLLLGLLQQRRRRKNVVAWSLEDSGLPLRKVREQVEEMWDPDSRAGEEIEFPFTPRSRSAVERARRESARLGHDYVDTLHLLLGLLEEPEGGAARIFYELNVNREHARQRVMDLLGSGG